MRDMTVRDKIYRHTHLLRGSGGGLVHCGHVLVLPVSPRIRSLEFLVIVYQRFLVIVYQRFLPHTLLHKRLHTRLQCDLRTQTCLT
jgi:hypothetical protein